IIRAAQILQDKNIHFYLTFDGTENKYAKRIYKLASELKNVHFLGYLNATEMVSFYQDSDIICFPSKLETWGLPLSEAKTYKKWIFAADLPYAHEVLYNYSKTRYFPFDDEKILVRYIL
ncbi:glycosyltransferase, partial [Escherichia coli]|nr:glycosyltransferase [Escherichia coli]